MENIFFSRLGWAHKPVLIQFCGWAYFELIDKLYSYLLRKHLGKMYQSNKCVLTIHLAQRTNALLCPV